METLEEPTKVIRRVDQVAKELPKVGRSVEDGQKHVVLPRKLKQGYIKDRWMLEERDARRNIEVLINQ